MSYSFRRHAEQQENGQEGLPFVQKISEEEGVKGPRLFLDGQRKLQKQLQMQIKIAENSEIDKSCKRRSMNGLVSLQSSSISNGIFYESESKNELLNISKESKEENYWASPRYKFDSAQSLLMPLNEKNHQFFQQPNQYGFYQQKEIKEEAGTASMAALENSNDNQGRIVLQKRKALYCIANTLRAFYQATNITINMQKLLKRDSLNKAYSSILNVCAKENKKMFTELEKERVKIQNIIRSLFIARKLKIQQGMIGEFKVQLKNTNDSGLSDEKTAKVQPEPIPKETAK